VNLECCFVWVWPQNQTFVRMLLHSRIGRLLRADIRRFFFFFFFFVCGFLFFFFFLFI